jgi:hypothetical protein
LLIPVVDIEDVQIDAPVVELDPPALADIVIVLATVSKDDTVVPEAIVTVLVDPATNAICCPTATFKNDDTLLIVGLEAEMFPVNDASALVKSVTSAYETPTTVEIADSTY